MLVYLMPEDASTGTPPGLMVGPYFVAAPTKDDRSPAGWWNIEAITGIAAERIVRSWKGTVNDALNDAAIIVAQEVAPIEDGVAASIEGVRRIVVRNRYARGILPILFVGRIERLLYNVRSLIEDVHEGVIFTCSSSEGNGLNPALIRYVRGRAELLRIDDVVASRGLCIRTVRFARPGKLPKDSDPTMRVPPTGAEPPPTLISDFVKFPPEWPEICGVIRMPSLRYDGSISDVTGYDSITKQWYEPDPEFRNIVIDETPTEDQIEWAKHMLLYPIHQFPLVDGWGPAISPLIERAAFRMINGPRPLYVYDAPVPRTGKTLLARTVGSVIVGHELDTSSWPEEDDVELEKRITTALRGSEDVILYDNIDDPTVESPSLARLATSSVWKSRILGATQESTTPNFITWMLTLNNAKLSRDLAMRSVLIRLDTGTADPSKNRLFSLSNPIGFALQHRAALVQAAMILVRSWVVAGQPYDPRLTSRMGGFERWLHVVGGTLYHAGIPGLPEALDAAAERDVRLDDERELIRVWATMFGTNAVSSRQVLDVCKAQGLFSSKLDDVKGTWGERTMTEILRRIEGIRRANVRPAMWILEIPSS